MAWSIPWDLIGLQVSGDVGGFTIYTSKNGKKVVFPKLPPEKPHTVAQQRMRDRFKAAMAAWKALTDAEKTSLDLMTRRLSIVMTGHNVYISIALKNDEASRLTLQQQSGVTLPEIPYIP